MRCLSKTPVSVAGHSTELSQAWQPRGAAKVFCLHCIHVTVDSSICWSVYNDYCCVLQALRALGCMEHRGACSADDDSGDGAGLMTQIPWKLLKKEMPEINEATTG